MRYSVYIKELVEDTGILVFLDGEHEIEMPLRYLPKGSRQGDILQLELFFDAFKTLKWREKLT